MRPAIITQNLTKKFGDFTAVDGINFSIEPGTVCGFLGHNGAGKTTLIRMLCGLLEPSTGSAQVLGFDVTTESEKIKQNIGYMSQKFSLYDDLTVIENLNFFGGIYSLPSGEREKRIREMIELAGLQGQEGSLVSSLTPGHKQRLSLGSALIARPPLLFLDEPTSGVSPIVRREFFNIIHQLSQQGVTIIVSTHFMDEAERCDTIAFMSQGKLLAFASPDELKEQSFDGILVEIEISSPQEMLPTLKNLPKVKDCIIYGSYLHVLLHDASFIPELEFLTQAKAEVVTPSLQETFLALARRKQTIQL